MLALLSMITLHCSTYDNFHCYMSRLAPKLTYRVPVIYKCPACQLMSGHVKYAYIQSMAYKLSVQDKDIALLNGSIVLICRSLSQAWHKIVSSNLIDEHHLKPGNGLTHPPERMSLLLTFWY